MSRASPPTAVPTPASPPDFSPRATVLFALALIALPMMLGAERRDAEPAIGAAAPASPEWRTLETTDGSHATRRHEAGGVVVGDALYLLGGRGRPPVERWSEADGGWRNLGAAPLELHHFQPVALDGRIHVVGAFTCCYPNESAVAAIHVFDTATETWDVAGSMPVDRVRGSAAAVERGGRIYVLGGNTRGHDGGAVPWFDVWDPASGTWTTLPDAPHARDHFAAVVVGDTLVAAAGRTSRQPNPAANPVLATDVYDFRTGTWRTAAPIPTPRAGTVGIASDGEAIIIGGEINTSSTALDTVEAFDVAGGTWRALPPLRQGRHGSGGGLIDERLHVVAGATSIGGATETHAHESLDRAEPTGGGGDDGADDGTGGDDGADGGDDAGGETDGSTDTGGADGDDAGETTGADDNDDGGAAGGDDGAGDDGSGTAGDDGATDGGDAGGTDDGAGSGNDGADGTSGDGGNGGEDGSSDGGGGDGDGPTGETPIGTPTPAPVADPPSRGSGGGGHDPSLALVLLPALALRSLRRRRRDAHRAR